MQDGLEEFSRSRGLEPVDPFPPPGAAAPPATGRLVGGGDPSLSRMARTWLASLWGTVSNAVQSRPAEGRQLRLIHEQLTRLSEETQRLGHRSEALAGSLDERTKRPYYCLDDGWGLTSLSTGQPFFVNTRDRNITPWIIMGGHWETNVDRVMCAYVQAGMTVLDIGAHFGYFTVKLGSLVGPSGHLYAFEPNPEVNAVCEENIKVNGLSGTVTLWKSALGDTPAIATLTFSRSNMASANLLGDQAADVSCDVEVGRIDNALPPHVTVDLIKLDAEGYEPMILSGGANTLARSPKCAIMLELNLDRWTRHRPIADLAGLMGHEKVIYAVTHEGGLRRMSLAEIPAFLRTCPYTENYFFFAPDDEGILNRLAPLMV